VARKVLVGVEFVLLHMVRRSELYDDGDVNLVEAVSTNGRTAERWGMQQVSGGVRQAQARCRYVCFSARRFCAIFMSYGFSPTDE
jgi:hypothetical protein